MRDLFDRWPGPGPETVGLEIDPLSWDTAEGVWTALRALEGAQGWVCRLHEVSQWPTAEQDGPVLSAELVGSDGTSLHVRRVDRGWRGWRYRELPTGDKVRFRETLLGTVPGSDKKLVYAVYWHLEQGPDGVSVYRPFAARFTGWEGA